MKRSVQEIIELVIFGLIALLVGTGVVWLLGQVMRLLGWVFVGLAALVWGLLKFLIPILAVAGLVYALVRWLQTQNRAENRTRGPSEGSSPDPAAPTVAATPHAGSAPAPGQPTAPAAAPTPEEQVEERVEAERYSATDVAVDGTDTEGVVAGADARPETDAAVATDAGGADDPYRPDADPTEADRDDAGTDGEDDEERPA